MDIKTIKDNLNQDFITPLVDTYASAKNGETVFKIYKVTPKLIAALDRFREQLDAADTGEDVQELLDLTAPGSAIYDYLHFDVAAKADRLRGELPDDGESTLVAEQAQELAMEAAGDLQGPFEAAVEDLYLKTR